MKTKLYLLLCVPILSTALCISGCNSKNEALSAKETSVTEIIEDHTEADTQAETQLLSTINTAYQGHLKIERSTGPGKEFLSVPLYYNEDFDILLKDDPIYQTYPSLITCLSMLESFYQADFITPDMYLKEHTLNTTSVDEIISDFADTNNYIVKKQNFDIETLGNILITECRKVLIYIPHSSIYGDYCSFFIVTDCTIDSDLCMRDPVRSNLDKYASYKDDEPLYKSLSFCEQASASSYMYTFIENGNGRVDE